MITFDLTRAIKCLKLCVFDFDGVFTTNQVIVSQGEVESVVCCRSDGMGLRLLRAEGLRLLILSTERNPVVQLRAKKLNVDCISACGNKARELQKVAAAQEIEMAEISYIGNDVNDLECLSLVGLPIAVQDAYPEVRRVAQWTLARCGGFGAVREFCEGVFKVRRGLSDVQSCWTDLLINDEVS